MTAAHNLLLPFKRTGRISGFLMFALVLGLGGSVYWTIQNDLPKPVLFVALGVFLLALLSVEALPLRKLKINAGDGLTVERKGLAFTRNGRTVRWRWDDITDLKLRHPFNPASLMLGQHATFRVPADERRSGYGFASDRLFRRGTVMVIGNDYASKHYDIFAQMMHFQNSAAGIESALGRVEKINDVQNPEPIWSIRKDRKNFKLWHAAMFALFPIVGLAVSSFAIDGLPESTSDLPSLSSLSTILYGALTMAPWLIVTMLKRDAAQDNMITITAGGISTRHNMERRHWLWWEISDIRVTQSTSRVEGGAAAKIISFRAMQDGELAGRTMIEGKAATPVSCTIEDDYEMPVDEIARRVKAWWDWSNTAFGHPDDPEVAEWLETQIGPQEQGISFLRHKGQTQQGSILESLYEGLSFVPMIAYTGWMLWIVRTESFFGLPSWGIIAGLVIFVVAPMIGARIIFQPGTASLEMDDDGLSFTRMGRTGRWRWQDVGTAELRRVRSKWSAKQRAVLTIEAPANGVGSAILRWAFNIDDRRLAIIEDIYDSPLDEIAEAINKRWREQGRRSS